MHHITWRKEELDLFLVPTGLLIMFGYHLFLIYRYLKYPEKTVIGYESHNKRAWVDRTMKVDLKDRGLALSVISNNLSAATSMSSISLVLSSLIGAWLGTSSKSVFGDSLIIYGETSPTIISIKCIAILSCFLVAFGSFVQSTKYYAHSTFLLSTPLNSQLPASYVEKAVIRGGISFSIGMRALYFAVTLLLWIFGAIPMFITSVIMVAALHALDTNSTELFDFKAVCSDDHLKRITVSTQSVDNNQRQENQNTVLQAVVMTTA